MDQPPPKPIPIIADQLSWSSQIGLFITNFGMLDYRVVEFLEERLPPEEFIKFRGRHFKDRLARIALLLPGEQRANFENFVQKVEPLRHLRNHIAHGYLLLGADEQNRPILNICGTGDIYEEHLPDKTRLKFAELQTANNHLCELIEEFTSATGQPEPRKTVFNFTVPSRK